MKINILIAITIFTLSACQSIDDDPVVMKVVMPTAEQQEQRQKEAEQRRINFIEQCETDGVVLITCECVAKESWINASYEGYKLLASMSNSALKEMNEKLEAYTAGVVLETKLRCGID